MPEDSPCTPHAVCKDQTLGGANYNCDRWVLYCKGCTQYGSDPKIWLMREIVIFKDLMAFARPEGVCGCGKIGDLRCPWG